MPEETKVDPFKPAQPNIPGVSSSIEQGKAAQEGFASAATQNESANISALAWVAMSSVVAVLVAGSLFYWGRDKSARPVQAAATSPEVASPVIAQPPTPGENLELGPGPVATMQELAKPWSAKRFLFRDPVSSAEQPAMVVRLPSGQFWGFSLREPFGNCELEYVSDLQKLRSEYKFTANHPMVGDPCNHTVYDLLHYGAGPSSDALVRGEIVQGAGIRPPMAIEIRTQGNKIVAVRAE